jgi:hypothetical protein
LSRWKKLGCGTKFFAGFAFHFEAPEKTQSPSLKFSRQLALNHIAPKKTVKISAFCKVTTCCQQGGCKRTMKLVFTTTLKTVKISAFCKVTTRCQKGTCKNRLNYY